MIVKRYFPFHSFSLSVCPDSVLHFWHPLVSRSRTSPYPFLFIPESGYLKLDASLLSHTLSSTKLSTYLVKYRNMYASFSRSPMGESSKGSYVSWKSRKKVWINFCNMSIYNISYLMFVILRFVTHLCRHRVNPGPASVTYYGSDVMSTPSGAVNLGVLRRQLSEAACLLYHLKPHAFVRSIFEGQPLASYSDVAAYNRASLLYFGTDTPHMDLRQCQNIVRLSRF